MFLVSERTLLLSGKNFRERMSEEEGVISIGDDDDDERRPLIGGFEGGGDYVEEDQPPPPSADERDDESVSSREAPTDGVVSEGDDPVGRGLLLIFRSPRELGAPRSKASWTCRLGASRSCSRASSSRLSSS